MTAADSTHSPFSGIALRHIKPVSTIGLITPYEKKVIGCNRKCACRLWTTCSYYNKMKWRKSREDEDEHMKTVWEYYTSIFRITYDMPIVNMNG